MAGKQPSVQELIQRNERLSTWHRPHPLFSEIKTPNKPRTAIISCLDPRSVPEDIFGLQFAEALSFRNLGGRVAANLDDLVALDFMLRFENVIVVHHSDCAVLHFTADHVRQDVLQLPDVTSEEADALVLPNYSSLEDSVREDLALLKQSKFLRPELKNGVLGFVYDIKTGKLSQVE